MKVVCISDTHTMHDRIDVPDGDLLIHAGDFEGRGTRDEAVRFASWFMAQPHKHKAVIAGNHSLALEQDPTLGRELFGDAYLFESETTVAGLRVWGAPWQPEFCNWAFNLPRGPALRAKWERIPDSVDIVVTHGPPHGVLDRTAGGELAGCEELRAALRRVKPKLHVFGHIHEGAGVKTLSHGPGSTTMYVNASVCTSSYQPVNWPVVVEL